MDLFCCAFTVAAELILPLIARYITSAAGDDPAALSASLIINIGLCYLGLRLLDALAAEKQRRAARTPHGRQSVKKLMNHYGAKNAIKLVGAPKDFDRIAREYHVDYAFHKTGPGQQCHLVLGKFC